MDYVQEKVDLFLFSGKMGTGKDYLANTLKQSLRGRGDTIPWIHLALADHFKVDAVAKHNCDFEKVYHQKDATSRKLLQVTGTEEGRAKYGNSIWSKTLATWIRVHYERGIRRFYITDVRMQDELAFFRVMSSDLVRVIAIRVVAPVRNRNRILEETQGDADARAFIENHPSEIDFDQVETHMVFDHVIRNDVGEDGTFEIQGIAYKL